MRTGRIVIVALVVLCLGEAALIAYLAARSRWQREAADTPIARGREVAERAGCFGCHGPGGTSPVSNPGAKYGEVPGWSGGTWAIWNNSEADVRAWIVQGHPPDRAPDDGALIPMPAYADLLDDDEVDDLVSYVLAVSQFGWIDDPRAKEGREIALRMGCFGCHGPEGRGLVENPGSFKGYVPPWDGDDYADLVRGDEEFRQWVLDGISERHAGNAAARAFLDRAAIRMPAYRDQLTADQVDALLAYVNWVRENPR